MHERAESVLRLVCLGLAAVLLVQVSRVVFRANPLGSIRLPEVPRWTGSTNTSNPVASSPGGMAASNVSGLNLVPPAAPQSSSPNTAAQRRLDQIVQSALLGPVIRPPPMALLGIAGEHVLLRAPNGQSGLIRTGEELGGAKLLRIGTNRVLVEENGQPRELTIFEGLGGESLLPKTNQVTP